MVTHSQQPARQRPGKRSDQRCKAEHQGCSRTLSPRWFANQMSPHSVLREGGRVNKPAQCYRKGSVPALEGRLHQAHLPPLKSDTGCERVGRQQIRSVTWEKTAEEAESPPKDTQSNASQGWWHLEHDVPLGGGVCTYQPPQNQQSWCYQPRLAVIVNQGVIINSIVVFCSV